MGGCYECGLDYQDPGWIEAIIPDKIWNEISPTGDQAGLLCITCISRRLIKKGYKNVPVWLQGTEAIKSVCGSLEHPANVFILRNWEDERIANPDRR